MAMRPADVGTVRLTNLIADSSATVGHSGSGVGTAPCSDRAWLTSVSWAMISATRTHCHWAWDSSSTMVSKPMSASIEMSV